MTTSNTSSKSESGLPYSAISHAVSSHQVKCNSCHEVHPKVVALNPKVYRNQRLEAITKIIARLNTRLLGAREIRQILSGVVECVRYLAIFLALSLIS